jgi:hypothetical protein
MNLSQLSNFMSVTPDKLYKATKAVEYAVKVYGEDYVAIDEYISSTLIGECLEYAQSLLENTKVADYMGVAVYTDGKTFSAPTLAIYNVESKPVIKQKIQAKVGSRNQRENDAQAMKKEELKQEEVGMLPEEDYDRMKDRRMERGGVDGNNRYPSNSTGSSKPHDPKKSAETNKKALDMVRASITAKYGKGAIIGAKNESLDPVGKEDSDIDNDGIKNDKNDKYISKRRKAIGKAIAVRKEERELEEAVLGRYKQDKGGGKTLRPASERTQTQTQAKSEPEGPKITKLKSKGPRKGEATASQVQGWRGSDRTNTNRRGQSAPQAKALAKEELEIEEALDKDFASMRKRGGRSAPPEERSPGGERNRNNKDYWADVQGKNRDRGKGNKAKMRAAALNKEELELGEEKRPFPFKKVEAQAEKARKGSVYGKPLENKPVPQVSDAEKKATTRFSKMSQVSDAAKRAKQDADKSRRSSTFYKDTHPASAPKMKKTQREEFELLSQYFVDEGIASNQTELDEIFENIDQEHYEYHLDKAMGLYEEKGPSGYEQIRHELMTTYNAINFKYTDWRNMIEEQKNDVVKDVKGDALKVSGKKKDGVIINPKINVGEEMSVGGTPMSTQQLGVAKQQATLQQRQAQLQKQQLSKNKTQQAQPTSVAKPQQSVQSQQPQQKQPVRKPGQLNQSLEVDGNTIIEKAPPGAKYERMVKHIKKGYAENGLTQKEKSISYATAWKKYKKDK